MNALGRHTESTLNIRAYTAHIQVGLPYAALAAQLGDNCTAATLAVVLARRVKMLQPRHGVAVALAGYSAGAVVATAVAAALEAEGEVVTVACREALFCRHIGLLGRQALDACRVGLSCNWALTPYGV